MASLVRLSCPLELPADHKNVRDAALKALSGTRGTLAQMRKEIGSQLKGLLALDRTFALGVGVLEWQS